MEDLHDDPNYQIRTKPNDDLLDTQILSQRLQLERSLLVAVRKLCIFVIVFVCFANGLWTYQPADEMGRVQRHLATHFNLDARKNITSLNELYSFMEAFAHNALVLQPESGKYWCEHAYFQRFWNVTLNAPVTRCSSSSVDSIVAAGGENKTFDRVRKFPGSQLTLSPAVVYQTRWKEKACTGFAESYNTLASKTGVGTVGVYSSHTGMINTGSTIAVRTMTLKEAKATCMTLPNCIGFTFQGLVTDDAVGIFFKSGNFSTTLGNWSSFKLESVISSRHGERVEAPLACVDRSKHTDEEFSHRITCTPTTCNTVLFSRRQEFRGAEVFPEILWKSGRDVPRLRQISWLDSFTDVVTVSAIAYTEGVETFTHVEVIFAVDDAGGLSSEMRIRSYKDKDAVNSVHYLGCLISALVFATIELLFSLFVYAHNSKRPSRSQALCQCAVLEFVIFLALLISISVLLITWVNQDSDDASQYKPLQSLLAATSLDDREREGLIKQFFVAAEQLCDRTDFLFYARITGYVILNLMFAQFVVYLRNHPKMQSVVDIVVCSFGDLVHFFMLVVPVFLMLGGLAHWAFGPYLEDFKTYSAALSTQVRRVYGEALFDAGFEERLLAQRLVMYWAYSLTMWLVVFWMFTYLLAAILIGQKRPQVINLNVANSFLYDVVDCVFAPVLSKLRRWPSQGLLMRALAARETSNGVLAVREIADLEPLRSTKLDTIENVIALYDWKCRGQLIVGNTLTASEQKNQVYAIPLEPKLELAAPPPEITSEPPGIKALPAEIPFLRLATQHALYAEVKKLVEGRLAEALLHKTQIDWESLTSELAVAAVDKAQQVVIRAMNEPDPNEFVVPLNAEHTGQAPEGVSKAKPGRFQTPKGQAPALLLDDEYGNEEASQITQIPGALDSSSSSDGEEV